MTLYRLLRNVNRDRFDHYVVSLTGGGVIADKIISLGFRVDCLDLKRSFLVPSTWRKLFSTVRVYKPDVVQCWMYHGNLVGTILRGFLVRKSLLVWNIRHSLISLNSNRFLTRQVIRLNKILSKRPCAIIYNSPRVAAEHVAYGYDDRATRVISNGFDTGLFRPNESVRISMRSTLGLKSEQVVIGNVARYHPVKDHENFCKAAAVILKTKPSVMFVMVGRGVTRDNKEFMALIKRYQLDNSVILMGESQDIEHLLPVFDIACSASRGESFPNFVGEAMACGIPCVATDVGQTADLIGDTGCTVPPSNSKALAKAVISLMDRGQSELEHLGEKARVRITDLFSVAAMRQSYEDLYSEQDPRSRVINANRLNSEGI